MNASSVGLAAPIELTDPVFGAQLAVPGDAPIVLAQPLEPDSWLASRLDRFGEAPCAILLEAANPRHHAGGRLSRWSRPTDPMVRQRGIGLASRLLTQPGSSRNLATSVNP